MEQRPGPVPVWTESVITVKVVSGIYEPVIYCGVLNVKRYDVIAFDVPGCVKIYRRVNRTGIASERLRFEFFVYYRRYIFGNGLRCRKVFVIYASCPA